jgi:hypothetical protein
MKKGASFSFAGIAGPSESAGIAGLKAMHNCGALVQMVCMPWIG